MFILLFVAQVRALPRVQRAPCDSPWLSVGWVCLFLCVEWVLPFKHRFTAKSCAPGLALVCGCPSCALVALRGTAMGHAWPHSPRKAPPKTLKPLALLWGKMVWCVEFVRGWLFRVVRQCWAPSLVVSHPDAASGHARVVFAHQVCFSVDGGPVSCIDHCTDVTLHGVEAGAHAITVTLRTSSHPNSATVGQSARVVVAVEPDPGFWLGPPTMGLSRASGTSAHVHSIVINGVSWRLVCPLHEGGRCGAKVTRFCALHMLSDQQCSTLHKYVVSQILRGGRVCVRVRVYIVCVCTSCACKRGGGACTSVSRYHGAAFHWCMQPSAGRR